MMNSRAATGRTHTRDDGSISSIKHRTSDSLIQTAWRTGPTGGLLSGLTKVFLIDRPLERVSGIRPKFMALNTNNCVAMHLFCHFNYRSLSDENKPVNYLH